MDECKPLLRGDGHTGDGVPGRRRHAVGAGHGHGKAVQVDPIKPTLKAPGTKRLKLKFDKPLSSFAFTFNLRRYNMVGNAYTLAYAPNSVESWKGQKLLTKVGRCRLTLSNPR